MVTSEVYQVTKPTNFMVPLIAFSVYTLMSMNHITYLHTCIQNIIKPYELLEAVIATP